MSTTSFKYTRTNYALVVTIVLAVVISWFFKWNYKESSINFMGGDAKDYYSTLVSTFITHDLTNQTGNDWFLLKTSAGTINVHPIGVSILLLPFFVLACLLAFVFNFEPDGFSFPFQLSVGIAALFYAVLGLVYMRKLFKLHGIDDKTTAIVSLLLFFGTNLLNYTLSEAGMSHVYSFSLISVFLYHSSKFISHKNNYNLLISFVILGLIVLVRPNNVLIVFSVFMWFKSWEECKFFFKSLFKNKMFYLAVGICSLLVFTQSIVWFLQSKSFFHYTYKADGFYWLNPQIIKMLFGFDGGLFIYVPLCLLFLMGLIVLFKENKFSFFATSIFLFGLFYFFASYWAYSYFDGLGIRVLVDYYTLFSFLGAKLFMQFAEKPVLYNSTALIAVFLLIVNLVYCFQANRNILMRAGMTYTKWKYVFMKTGVEYQNVLGGSNEIVPYSAEPKQAVLEKQLAFDKPFDFSQREYGVGFSFDSIGFRSNRVSLNIKCRRKELQLNASKDALICGVLEDRRNNRNKSSFQFRLNEAPSKVCCEEVEYNYISNISADFEPGDKLSVFLWNSKKQPFLIDQFSVKVYNYNFKIN